MIILLCLYVFMPLTPTPVCVFVCDHLYLVLGDVVSLETHRVNQTSQPANPGGPPASASSVLGVQVHLLPPVNQATARTCSLRLARQALYPQSHIAVSPLKCAL